MENHLLHDHWVLSHFDPADSALSHPPEQGWLPANIPGTVQTSAFGMSRKMLYRGANVQSVQWMDQRMWVFQRTVEVPQINPDKTSRLVFEGLDYRYEVWLDSERRIAGEGMFHPVFLSLDAWRGQSVEVEVRLLPPPATREDLWETTKAQFGRGWDFTPTLRTLGIWDEVRLEIVPKLRVESAWIETRLENRQRARVTVHAELSQEVAQGWAQITLCGSQRTVPILAARHLTSFIEVESPQLWWPNGLGEPILHDLEITLDVPDRRTEPFQQRVGLREVTRLPAYGQRAKDIPLQFAVNGLLFFINGVNWVPPDAAVGDITPTQYDRPLEIFRAGHVNLVRVWGGGLCEKAHFYNRCDELGLLVFQEYPIACGMGSSEPYLRQLQSEAREIVRKLRRHPCVFLFCGGNENYHYWHMLNRSEPLIQDALKKGLQAIGTPFDNPQWLAGAVKRYDEPVHLILGGITADLAPHCLYQNTSPMEDEGEVHGIWNWNPILGDHRYRMFGTNYDYWRAASQALYSEASVSSIANLETILEVTGQGADSPVPDSEDAVWNLHHAFHGAWDKARDLWLDLPSTEKVFGPIATLRELVPLSQYLQAEGGRFMIEELRRKQPRATGIIWWGVNEPWPGLAGNALIDYYGCPKASWPYIANAFAPVILSLRYDALQPDLLDAELWLSCNAPTGFSGRYTAVILDSDKGEIARIAGSCGADYLQSQPLARLLPVRMNAGQQVTVQTTLTDQEDRVIHSNIYLFGEIRAAVLQTFGRSSVA